MIKLQPHGRLAPDRGDCGREGLPTRASPEIRLSLSQWAFPSAVVMSHGSDESVGNSSSTLILAGHIRHDATPLFDDCTTNHADHETCVSRWGKDTDGEPWVNQAASDFILDAVTAWGIGRRRLLPRGEWGGLYRGISPEPPQVSPTDPNHRLTTGRKLRPIVRFRHLQTGAVSATTHSPRTGLPPSTPDQEEATARPE